MLHCPQSVIGAGQMYFMRFYRREENREKYSPFFMAMTCIYLATKVEEEIRRHRDILTVSFFCVRVFSSIRFKKRTEKIIDASKESFCCYNLQT